MSCSRCSTTIGGSSSAGCAFNTLTPDFYRAGVQNALRRGSRNALRTGRRETSGVARRYGALALAVGTLLLVAAGFVLGGGTFGGTNGFERGVSVNDVLQLISVLATAYVGLVIALRRPENPIGWIFGALGLITATFLAADGYAIRAIVLAPGLLPGGEWAAWFRHSADRCASALPLLAFLLFPSGHLASRRWRAALLLPPLAALGFAARAFVPGPLGFLGVPNPVGVEWIPRVIDDGATGGIPLIVGSVVAACQLVLRYRTTRASEREQIKWLALPLIALLVAMAATVAAIILDVPADVGVNGAGISSLYAIAQFALPVCMAIAILRYRLYDIDVLINRALVYGATTAGIALSFFIGILVLQAILRPITNGSEIAVAVSTLASVGLRDEVDLDAVRGELVAAVRDTVQPTHASVWLRQTSR